MHQQSTYHCGVDQPPDLLERVLFALKLPRLGGPFTHILLRPLIHPLLSAHDVPLPKDQVALQPKRNRLAFYCPCTLWTKQTAQDLTGQQMILLP